MLILTLILISNGTIANVDVLVDARVRVLSVEGASLKRWDVAQGTSSTKDPKAVCSKKCSLIFCNALQYTIFVSQSVLVLLLLFLLMLLLMSSSFLSLLLSTLLYMLLFCPYFFSTWCSHYAGYKLELHAIFDGFMHKRQQYHNFPQFLEAASVTARRV